MLWHEWISKIHTQVQQDAKLHREYDDPTVDHRGMHAYEQRQKGPHPTVNTPQSKN